MRTLSGRARITTALCGLSLLACALSACSSSSNGSAGTHPGNGSAGTNTGNGSCLPQWCLFPGTLVAASGAKYRAEFDATIYKPGFIALPTLTITGGPVAEDSAGCREGTTGDIQIEIAIPAEHATRDANGNLHVSWSEPDDPEIIPSAIDLTITSDNTVTGTLTCAPTSSGCASATTPMLPSDGGAPEELTVAGKMSLDCGVMDGDSQIPLADGTAFALTCGVQPAPAGLCNDQP
jgi:hypothetical protein